MLLQSHSKLPIKRLTTPSAVRTTKPTHSGWGAKSQAGAQRAPHSRPGAKPVPQRAGGAMYRRITRAIFAAAAAGATIATFGLTAAGTAGAATSSVRVADNHHIDRHLTASPAAPALVLVTRHFAGYHTASNETRRF